MRKVALFLLLSVSPALAQNPTCPTRLAGDSSNACASTSFAQQLLSGGFATAVSPGLFFAGPIVGATASPPAFRVIASSDIAFALTTPPQIGTTTPNIANFSTLQANALFAVTGTFSTSAITPKLIGGSGTTGRQLTLQTTTGVGTTDSLALVGGNAGQTIFGMFDANGLTVSQVVYAISGLKTSPITVDNLAVCNSTNMGLRAFVTDQSTTIAYHGPVVSGGSFKQGVICDGTSWYQN